MKLNELVKTLHRKQVIDIDDHTQGVPVVQTDLFKGTAEECAANGFTLEAYGLCEVLFVSVEVETEYIDPYTVQMRPVMEIWIEH